MPALTISRKINSLYAIVEILTWSIEIEPEVEEWLQLLDDEEFVQTAHMLDRLSEQGNAVRMPHSRALGEGLFELRYICGGVARRIAYWFGARKHIILLTTFRKQRNNERHEVSGARLAKRICEQKHTELS